MEAVFGKYSGTIFSPDYPVPYPDDASCGWRLVAPRDKEIKLKFVDFELRGSSMNDVNNNCMKNYTYRDHVEMSDGSRPFHGGISCGNQTTPEVYSIDGIMYVEFRAIPVGVQGKRGFKAHFEAVDLSGICAVLRIQFPLFFLTRECHYFRGRPDHIRRFSRMLLTFPCP